MKVAFTAIAALTALAATTTALPVEAQGQAIQVRADGCKITGPKCFADGHCEEGKVECGPGVQNEVIAPEDHRQPPAPPADPASAAAAAQPAADGADPGTSTSVPASSSTASGPLVGPTGDNVTIQAP